MNNQPLVSVGIPTYNRPIGLRRTLDCITKQTYKNIQIIVSDNCSPDLEVDEIINEFLEKDNRIIFYKQEENFGALNNFTIVLEKSTGDYFMWAADDDEWGLDFIEKNLNLILSDKRYVASFSNFYEIDINGNRIFGHPEHLTFLKQISNFDKYERLHYFIKAHENFGKANLFYSLIKSDILKILFKNFSYFNHIASDDLFVLSWLCEGNLAIVDSVLYHVTAENEKFIFPNVTAVKKRTINLLILKIDINIINFTINGWLKYFFAHFPIISRCNLSSFKKVKLYCLITYRIILLFYDIITFAFSTPYKDIFGKLRRKNVLINIVNSKQ